MNAQNRTEEGMLSGLHHSTKAQGACEGDRGYLYNGEAVPAYRYGDYAAAAVYDAQADAAEATYKGQYDAGRGAYYADRAGYAGYLAYVYVYAYANIYPGYEYGPEYVKQYRYYAAQYRDGNYAGVYRAAAGAREQ